MSRPWLFLPVRGPIHLVTTSQLPSKTKTNFNTSSTRNRDNFVPKPRLDVPAKAYNRKGTRTSLPNTLVLRVSCYIRRPETIPLRSLLPRAEQSAIRSNRGVHEWSSTLLRRVSQWIVGQHERES
mmetsp:Transcript_8575/g.18016  ORF Transcript_8575/g.18016 Transcript_8575/m.18016 type:complete len:125 (-) Transcript_8575:23-397(-)